MNTFVSNSSSNFGTRVGNAIESFFFLVSSNTTRMIDVLLARTVSSAWEIILASIPYLNHYSSLAHF